MTAQISHPWILIEVETWRGKLSVKLLCHPCCYYKTFCPNNSLGKLRNSLRLALHLVYKRQKSNQICSGRALSTRTEIVLKQPSRRIHLPRSWILQDILEALTSGRLLHRRRETKEEPNPLSGCRKIMEFTEHWSSISREFLQADDEKKTTI